jgi:arsenate reductase
MTVTIWHNPRCSKSRQTLALIESQGVEPVIVEYLKTPPSREDITRAVKLLGIPAAVSCARVRKSTRNWAWPFAHWAMMN